ncbi:MAG TPA: phenylacetate--CoA ligase family protein [Burkholderiales bacterium]|jgi:phenylacetate-CoA ligase
MAHPLIARRLVFPLQEHLLKRPTFAYLEALEQSQWLCREELERLQSRKLAALLRIAVQHSPWHAERIGAAGLDVAANDAEITLEELRRVPTMTKQDARANVDRIHWSGVPGGSFPYTTGGSSGEPLQFYFGRWRQASDAAGRIRARRWWGVDLGDREVYLWGAPVELNRTDHIKSIRDRLLNQLLLNAFEMSVSNMDGYLEAIQAFRPKCIYGYASSVALLAARAMERRMPLRLPDLRVVCTTGEPLYPHQRAIIEKVFGVPAANEFGSRDAGFIAHESPHGQLLLMSESNVLEILDGDGQPVPPGQAGEAVITGLCSEAQPFIRYRTGDIVRMSVDSCRDGRGLHVLRDVSGRTTDFIVRPDGTIMHALAVIYVLRAVEGIAAFKFIQHRLDEVEVLIVPGSNWSDMKRMRVMTGLAARLGDEMHITVRLVESIPAEASGKHRYVVSHVASQARLDLAGGEIEVVAREQGVS